MTMTTMMKKTDAQSVRQAMPTLPTRDERSRKFSGIANSGPTLPTRDEYRDGMNKLREQLDCPVLSVDEQALADDLSEYDWSAEHSSPAATIPKRPSVDDYLKQQYQKNMLARYPEFERRTDTDIAALKHALDQMYVFNVIMVMALVFALVIAAFAWLI